MSWIAYFGLLSVIPNIWLEQLVQENVVQYSGVQSNFDFFISKPKPTNLVYSKYINQKIDFSSLINDWSSVLKCDINTDMFIQCFANLYKSTLVTKLRNFQFRLLWRKLPTNRHLYRWGIKWSNLCSLCGLIKETLEDLFLECSVTRRFLNQSERFIKDNCYILRALSPFKEGLMLILNKLFRKQVKSFCLLLDQDPFISCVRFTTQSTSSSQVYKLFPSLSHSFPTVCFPSLQFCPEYNLSFFFFKSLQNRSKTDPKLCPTL